MNGKHARDGLNFIQPAVIIAALTCIMLGLVLWMQKQSPASSNGPAVESTSSQNTSSADSTVLPTSSVPVSNKLAASNSIAVGAGGRGAGNSREFDIAVNPYAAALREAGRSKRAWETDFLQRQSNAVAGDPIQFELTGGVMASGMVKIVQRDGNGVTYMSGELSAPESGKFFFLRPPVGGRAGSAVGVIEFPTSHNAYRIEPTGDNGVPELWQRRMDEVICLMPVTNNSASDETVNAPPLRPDLVPEIVPSYNSNIVSLQSLPGARGVCLLDFFGGYTATWGGVYYSAPNVGNAAIRDLWKRMAEDFMPLNINVTTDRKVFEAAPEGSRQRCVFAPDAPTAVYWPDNNLNGAINEIRVWAGSLTPAQVATNYALGPNVLARPSLTVTASGGGLAISWPETFPGYTLQSSPVVGAGAVWNPVGTTPVLSGGFYSVTLPVTNTSAFFRLAD